ncbi:MAG: TonB-dependent hemoglobin/transferrin/lactoferrin family receptor [Hyphomicrobiaceae bacterium]
MMALLVGTASVSLPGLQPARAQQTTRTFNIPAQPLASALTQFGQQSGLQVSVNSAATQGRSSPGVSGALPVDQALSRLLSGTGMSFRFSGSGTAIISASSAGGNNATATVDGAIALDTIDVSGGGDAASGSGYQGTPDWVYKTPSSVSVVSREAIKNSPARNTRDLLDNVAGVVVNRSEAQNPGIVISMRGVQDQDRIATMIDGARQSFQRSGHGATQRVYVESAFLRGIEVNKTTGSGVGGIGALAGSVNFRTVEAKDLIKDGKDWGVEINSTVGTNAYLFDGSVLGAWRPTESFAVTAGLSNKSIGAYKIGQNGEVERTTTFDDDILLFSGQKVKSGLLKVEIDPNPDLSLKLAWVRNNSNFSTGNFGGLFNPDQLSETKESVVVDTLTAAAHWNPADNGLIDLKARIYHNRLKNVSHSSDRPNAYMYTTTGGSLENTSRGALGAGTVSLNYGTEAFHDTGETTLGRHWLGTEDYADRMSGATPSGGRTMASGFANAAYEDNIFLVSGGLRYDWYHTKGSTAFFNYTRDEIGWNPGSPGVCLLPFPPPRQNECRIWRTRPVEPGPIYSDWYNKPHGVDIERSGAALLPNAKVAVKPTDWLQIFAGYSQSYRPPTVMETFINGSAHQNSVTEFAPNPFLEPERARTFEIGANISADGVLTPDDSVRLKVTGFRRYIDDYIAYGRIRHPLTADDAVVPTYTTFVNLIDRTEMRGIELEANYDARFFYVGGSATWLKSDFGLRYRSFQADGSPRDGYLFDDTAPVVFIAPDFKLVLDAGVRLFDEKLTLGAKMIRLSETKPMFGQFAQVNNRMPGYTTYDIYGSYKFDENATLRAAVTNVTDLAYVSALGSDWYAAPGRTATAGLQIKF